MDKLSENTRFKDNLSQNIPFMPLSPKTTARKAIRDRDHFFGEHPLICQLTDQLQRVASKSTSILLEGETGTGKSFFARKIHQMSQRQGQFVVVNCATLGRDLLESELFGHTKGAFTGAQEARLGLVASAEGGTLFLDEISELPLELQAKLLYLLEEKKYRAVGSDKALTSTTRIVAATNQPLKQLVNTGRFRSDLFYRLSVLPFYIPALREHADDIAGLVEHFSTQLCEEHHCEKPNITAETLANLQQYTWPGNIRELRNQIERALILGQPFDHGLIQSTDRPTKSTCLKTQEKHLILDTLDAYAGDKEKTASQLGISRRTLDRKLNQWKNNAA